jgi:hypothetical protein
MSSLTSSHHLRIEDPEDRAVIIAAAKKSGLIKQAAPTKTDSPFDAAAVRRVVAEAKASGQLKAAISILNPAEIARAGADVVTGRGVVSQWVDVTPGMAAHWLQNNFVNRPISDDTVAAYARDMVNGVWVCTHQGVAFNDLDHLIDGQHRLHAIVKSGVTVRMMVTFGLASKIEGSQMTTMDAVDRGRTRSVADQLKIQHGLKNGSFIAAVCASLAVICCNDRTRRLSVGQTLEIYAEFRAAVDWIHEFRPTEHGLRAKGVLAAFAFAVTADCKLKAPCISVVDGGGLVAGSPLALLREFLVSDDAKLLNRGSDRALAELTLHALQLQIAGESIERLELSQNGLHAFRSLQAERVAVVANLFRLPS